MTVDGVAVTFHKTNPTSAAYYEAAFTHPHLDNQGSMDISGTYTPSRAFLLEGRSVKIEVEITGGTVSNLSARVKYAKMV